MNNPRLHTFPEDNLSQLTKQTDSIAMLSIYFMRGWTGKPEGLWSLPAAWIVQINQEFLAFDMHCPKGWQPEVETQHVESELHSLWDWPPGEDDWGILIPTWFGVGLMSPYTLAAVEKHNEKFTS